MSLESSFYTLLSTNAALTAIVGTRIYPVVTPTGAVPPCLVWQRVGSEAADLGGRAVRELARVDIDCYAETFDGAAAIGEAVRACIEGSVGAVRGQIDDISDAFEEGPRYYRRSLSATLYFPAD